MSPPEDGGVAGLYERGVALVAAKQLDEALRCFRAIIAHTEPVRPVTTDDEIRLPYQGDPSEFAQAEAQSKAGKPVALVMDWFTAAIYNIGCIHGLRQELDQACRYLEEVLTLWPENVSVKIDAAHVYAGLGRFQTAIATLQEAQAVRPEEPRIYSQLAWVYNEMEEPERALTAAERAVSLDPAHNEGLKELALAQEKLGRRVSV